MAEKRITREMKLEIVRQYHTGKSVRQLAREWDYSTSSVYRWIKEFAASPSYEEPSDGFSMNDLCWMYSMITTVKEENKLAREMHYPSWFVN